MKNTIVDGTKKIKRITIEHGHLSDKKMTYYNIVRQSALPTKCSRCDDDFGDNPKIYFLWEKVDNPSIPNANEYIIHSGEDSAYCGKCSGSHHPNHKKGFTLISCVDGLLSGSFLNEKRELHPYLSHDPLLTRGQQAKLYEKISHDVEKKVAKLPFR